MLHPEQAPLRVQPPPHELGIDTGGSLSLSTDIFSGPIIGPSDVGGGSTGLADGGAAGPAKGGSAGPLSPAAGPLSPTAGPLNGDAMPPAGVDMPPGPSGGAMAPIDDGIPGPDGGSIPPATLCGDPGAVDG